MEKTPRGRNARSKAKSRKKGTQGWKEGKKGESLKKKGRNFGLGGGKTLGGAVQGRRKLNRG